LPEIARRVVKSGPAFTNGMCHAPMIIRQRELRQTK